MQGIVYVSTTPTARLEKSEEGSLMHGNGFEKILSSKTLLAVFKFLNLCSTRLLAEMNDNQTKQFIFKVGRGSQAIRFRKKLHTLTNERSRTMSDQI